ncbi:MAG: murein L,D-transpeptidase catalytic domain family protein [Myxococcota bacterium]
MSQRSSLLVCLVCAFVGVGCDSGPRVERATLVRDHAAVAGRGAADPSAPSEPDLGDPGGSDDPVTTPTDPTAPTDPTDPADPTDPVDPADPTDPADPNDPTDPTTPATDDAILVTSFPFVDRNDTASGARALDHYSCAPNTREGGPEVVYAVTVPVAGLLVASVDDLSTGVDVDVHILSARSASACLDRGNSEAAAWVPAGEYVVVADSWVNASGVELAGPYTLTVGLTTADAFVADGLDADVLARALHVFDRAWAQGDTDRLEYTVIDFSRFNGTPRLWTIDLHDGSLTFVQHVTHGAGSDDPDQPGWARTFSNVDGSHQSSLGLMRTASRYQSASNGLSLLLDGLEPDINDDVRAREIVIHSDSYASDAYVAAHGKMGNSWGCQVVDPAVIEEFVDTVEGGALVWSWFPDPSFVAASTYLDP